MKKCRVVIADTGWTLLNVAEVALTSGERMRGLLGRSGLPAGEGLFLPHCWTVHTFFMRFPIDVAYVTSDNTVVKLVDELKPWRISWCWLAQSAVEMPAGWAQKIGLSIGHVLNFPPLDE